MKFFVFGDVHGHYDLLMKSLEEAGFDINNPDHIICSLGDLLDRGDKPLQCLKFVNSLPETRKILICGNHEILMDQCLARKEFWSHDYHNGTAQTIADLGDYGDTAQTTEEAFEKASSNPEWTKYRKSLSYFAEVGDYVLVHGWIPCDVKEIGRYEKKYTPVEDWKHGDWLKAMWHNGMEAWNQGVRLEGKTILCGHWHTSYARAYIDKTGVEWNNPYSTNPDHQKADFSTWENDGIVALDACTAYSHKVNIYTFEI